MGHSWEKGWLEDWIWGLFWTHPMRLCLRHVESTATWSVWIEAALCFCCCDFLEVFLTVDTRLTWSPRGLYFLSNNQPQALTHLQVLSTWWFGWIPSWLPHGCHSPPALPFSNAMFPGKQHHDLLVDPFLFSPFPSHTVAATHLWRNSQPNKPPLAQLS